MDPSLLLIGLLANLGIFNPLLFDLDLPGSFTVDGFCFALFFHLSIFSLTHGLDFEGFGPTRSRRHLFALDEPLVRIGVILFFQLLIKQFLN